MNTQRIAITVLSGLLAVPVLALPKADMQADSANETAKARQETGMRADVRDAWLDGKLETALLFNQHLNSFSIDTEVENGVAYLTGAVESDIDRDLAAEIAKSIDGVVRVENQLVVDETRVKSANESDDAARKQRSFKQAVTDATLTAKVKSQLLLNENTKGLQIDVDSRNGEVTLSGKVASAEEKQLAEMIADNANGEAAIHSRLQVSDES